MTKAAQSAFVNLDDFEKNAYETMDRNALDYYRSGSQDMITVRENQRAFDRIIIRPRVLRDVSHIDMSTRIQGHQISSPICIAPTAMQRMAHPEGECATARASQRQNTCMVLSSWSTTSIEDVAASTKSLDFNQGAPKWLQLYIYKDRQATRKLIERAQDSGFSAIALTVDTPFLGRRLADIRNRFRLPPHLTMANFSDQKAQVGKADASSAADNASGLAAYVASQIDPTLSWKHVQWVKSVSRIPVLVKGILTAEDALLAVKAGVDGIIVSNHGGRQMDTAPATIDVLEEVCKAVAGRVEVYLDGGVRRGTDVFKALALGAKAVFLGRPALWALHYNGEDGVVEMLDIINEEFRLAMALAGCVKISDIKREHLRMPAHACL
ncbi:Hydroxyacid oxidase 1 [Coemansia sp. RSA 989]|nr:FMN-dependent dehydrogenase [Coemansia mojavensis]KAJ1742824.1 Hydroxyacid oxidase 1 [Coemansia sp. RSA 1086]KAJ1751449.1 Hydroxyacid oxidase 1 [Coemansia sp. RSA 1821]KAJ1866494.1 Hydroxyacid oxidase 1 [Coemansia sp. RSA 989]KAJ1873858.1 Hydroxyacid oxidase 1 [Coemansia sp. RSA 990]KAJ2648332.1 Hydroxyacid oxidase 1 [Coemansia sp. RSA 1250]KAJ2670403.1 Hydroxyacid oxidase 1 [Coemansia sp. RSA 1085]